MGDEYKRGYKDGWNAALDEAEVILMAIMASNRGAMQAWDGNGTTGNATTTGDSALTRTGDGGNSSIFGLTEG